MNFLRKHWPILLPAFVYVWIFPYIPALRSPNEICRTYQTRAIVDHGTMEINAVMHELGPIGDLSCVAIAHGIEGAVERKPCPAVGNDHRFSEWHYYPSKAPLISVMTVPVYAVLKAIRGPVREVPLIFFGRLFCTILPTILLIIPIRRFLREYVSSHIADALTATYALGTLAFSYSELFMSHQATGVLLFLCFYVLWRVKRGKLPTSMYAVAGFLAGLTVTAEYTGALGLIPLAVYAVATARGGRIKAIALGLLGVLPPAILLGWYHKVAFGSPFDSGYKFLNQAGYQSWHTGGFLGIGLPEGRAFVLSFFSPLRGLFTLAPFLILAIPGLFVRKARPEVRLSFAMLVLYTYFTSSFSYDSWGWTTGPRHLTPLVPFLLLPIALLCDTHRAWTGVTAGLAALSILVTSVMTFVNYFPDALTNGLTQLALPFAFSGRLPHSILSLAGVPNPWAALPAVIGVLVTAVLVLWSFRLTKKAAITAAVTMLAVSGLLVIAQPPPGPDGDQGRALVEMLRRDFVPRPGQPSPRYF